MIGSMEAARRLKSAAEALERAKRWTLDMAVVCAEGCVNGSYTDEFRDGYVRAKESEAAARRAYRSAVDLRLEVADYRKARREEQRGDS